MLSLLKLGELTHEVNKRDAVHTPVFTACALTNLKPGQKVKILLPIPNDGTNPYVQEHKGQDYDGVVDPFLTKTVKSYENCLVLVKPNVVTEFFHTFEHPSLPKNEEAYDKRLEDEEESLYNYDRYDGCGPHCG